MSSLVSRCPLSAVASVVLAATVPACATNPATGQKQFSLISEGQEIQMGLQADTSVVASMGLDPDSGRQRYLRELGLRLARASERPNLPWTFRVIDDPVVNAFAIPGGHIYVTRGIMAHLGDEAELAAVLGHEIGHVTARHSVTQMSRQQLAQIGLVVGTALKPELQRYAGLAAQGLGLLFLKYSRDDESQADQLGFRYMRRAGYDARRMPDVFALLDRVSKAGGGDRIPDWLSTHPNPVNRRQTVERYIAALPAESLGTIVNRDDYLRHVDGIIFGDNPREGFFKGTDFYHPDLRFRLTFPQGWHTQNQRQAVLGASPQQDALVQLSLADQGTPEAAAQAFFGQEGVSGSSFNGSVHGFAATAGEFSAATDQGPIAGRATFIAYEGRVYRVLGYAGQDRWPGYAAAVRGVAASFDRLADPAVLAVEPWRVDIVTLPRAMTFEEFLQRYPGPATPEATALVNNVDAGARFPAGALLKRIIGKPLP
jgi:predicted Zn-dependent protease